MKMDHRQLVSDGIFSIVTSTADEVANEVFKKFVKQFELLRSDLNKAFSVVFQEVDGLIDSDTHFREEMGELKNTFVEIRGALLSFQDRLDGLKTEWTTEAVIELIGEVSERLGVGVEVGVEDANDDAMIGENA